MCKGDEPSAGLAPTIVADVRDVIEELRSGGMAILLVEQASELALAAADQVVVLDLGRVVHSSAAMVPGIREVVRAAYAGVSQPASG